MSDITKNDTSIAAAYTKALSGTDGVATALDTVRKLLKAQIDEVSEFSEARRRLQDKELYDLTQQRQAVIDEHEREDRERAREYEERIGVLTEAEDELLSLLNIERDAEDEVPSPKFIRASFEAFVKRAETAAATAAAKAAAADYATSKRIDAAEAAKHTALIEQKNAYLESQNAVLVKQNQELLAQQTTNLDRMKDLATRGLEASAGIQGKANDSLASAALAGSSNVKGR